MKKKIVILGCENSHASLFLRFIKYNPKYSNVEVLGVYSDEEAPAQRLHERFGVYVMKSYDEFVGQVDGVVNTARDGANRYKYVKPYMEAGVPMFLDKPVCIGEEEALEFMREAKKYGVKVTGGSSLKHDEGVKTIIKKVQENENGKTCGGLVRSSIEFLSQYSGYYFYAQHFVDVATVAFGRYPNSVMTYKPNKEWQKGDTATVVINYDNYAVTATIYEEGGHYFVGRLSEKNFEGYDILIDTPIFLAEWEEFYELLMGGEQKESNEDFISPVFVMEAAMRSFESGKEEKVNRFKL